MNPIALLVLCYFVLTACSLRTVRNSDEKKPETALPKIDTALVKNNTTLTADELAKYAYEIGLDPKSELTSEEFALIEKRKKVRVLERSLDSQKERYNYSKVLPWLQSDEEKLEYLGIPSIEGRQAWVNKKQIWKRTKNNKEYQNIMESLDIALGMPTDFVKKAWGEPDSIDHSGNPIYKNERWKYHKQISTPNGYRQEKRYVYFEGGRVVGWETE